MKGGKMKELEYKKEAQEYFEENIKSIIDRYIDSVFDEGHVDKINKEEYPEDDIVEAIHDSWLEINYLETYLTNIFVLIIQANEARENMQMDWEDRDPCPLKYDLRHIGQECYRWMVREELVRLSKEHAKSKGVELELDLWRYV